MAETLRSGSLVESTTWGSGFSYDSLSRGGDAYPAVYASSTHANSDFGHDGSVIVFGSVKLDYLLRAYRYANDPPDFEEWIGSTTSDNPSGDPTRDRVIVARVERS